MEELVPERRLVQLKDQLTKDCVHTVENFSLYDARQKHRRLDHPLRLCFTYQTRGKQISTPARKISSVSSQCSLLDA